jgi:hypothetical protein
MSKIDRLIQIRKEERNVTIQRINASDLSDRDNRDVTNVFVTIQEAVNAWVRKEDRFVKPQVLDAALSELLYEFRRINERLGNNPDTVPTNVTGKSSPGTALQTTEIERFQKKLRVLASSVQEELEYPCAIVSLIGMHHGEVVADAYTLTAKLKEGWLDHGQETAIGLVDHCKPEFHRDNDIWPALAIVGLFLGETPVAEATELMAGQLAACKDQIQAEAPMCRIQLLVMGLEG